VGLWHGRTTDPSVTLRVYAHVIRDQVAAPADIVARSIPAGAAMGTTYLPMRDYQRMSNGQQGVAAG